MEPLFNWTDPLIIFMQSDNFSYPEDSPEFFVANRIQILLLPFIFFFGVLGNVLAIGCFLSQSLRAASCCLYMAAKCISDTAFLVTLFIIWLNRLHLNVLNVQGVCQLTVFISYVSSFVSVWLVLAVTYENYICICCPSLTKTRCTRRVAFMLIGVIVFFAIAFYSFALWTTNVLTVDANQPFCMSVLKFKDVLFVMTFIDTMITLVLPCLIIVPLVFASLVAIFRAYDRKHRLHDSLLGPGSTHSFQRSLEAKVAKFLLSVSLTFLLLHTPGHLLRLKLLVKEYFLHLPLTTADFMLQRVFETFYYFNFGCSVVIFLMSGANFRAIFLSMYCQRGMNTPCPDDFHIVLNSREPRIACANHAFDPESVQGLHEED